MNLDEYTLACISEELSEIIIECAKAQQRIDKALRFGLDEVQPGQDLTNRARIRAELHDLMGSLEIANALGVIQFPNDRDAIEEKKMKLLHYMDYSEKLGALKRSE
jgi:hypothetical protein